jgi:hypothetical protein
MSGAVEQYTFRDVLDHMVDYERANPSTSRSRFHRRAVFGAMREVAHEHHWSYFYQSGRINTVAPYMTGTIEFDYTGGTWERQMTITDGTWPAWAAYGTIIINDIQYSVAERQTGSVLQLSIHSTPHEDIAAGTGFTLMRDCYLLPADFWTIDQLYTPQSWRRLSYVHPREWLVAHRYNTTSSNTPFYYTIRGSQDFQGCMEICFYPFPDTATSIDFTYSRRPRKIQIEDEHAGEVTVSTGSTTVAGNGTAFNADMVGSIIRIADGDPDELPTGRDGVNPYKIERMIMNVVSATSLVMDQNAGVDLSDVKYVISDPIDIEPGVMGTVFLRCAENQLAKMARFSDREAVEREYQMALIQAREADSRSTAPRSVETESLWTRRLAYMPAGPDVD